MYLVGLYLTVILSVLLFTLTQLFTVSFLVLVLVLFLWSLVLGVGPTLVVAIVTCVVFGALGVWFRHSEMEEAVFVLPLCVVALSVYCPKNFQVFAGI